MELRGRTTPLLTTPILHALLLAATALLLAPRGAQAQAQTLHSVGFGMGYLPGPGVHVRGLYEYRGIEPGTVGLGLGWSEALFGSAGYRATLELDHLGYRRLTAGAELFSEYVPNRLLDGPAGPETDERRGGVLGRLTLDARLGGPATTLNTFLEARRAHIRLAPSDAEASTRTLTSLDAGSFLTRSAGTVAAPQRLLLVMRVRAGYDAGWFTVASGSGSLRRPLAGPLEAYVEGRAAWASAGAPAYEQASFGGMQLVRGYRQDAIVGRRLWGVQTELWSAIPGTVGAASGAAGLLGRHVRLAGFIDVGGVYEAIEAEPGIRAGAGAGVRLLLGPGTVRIDWATGLTPGLPQRARGHLYVSISAGLPGR